MNRYISYFWALFFFLPLGCWCDGLNITIEGEAGILINADTGAVLFEKKAHAQLFPASTTKVATALFALKLVDNNLQRKITAETESVISLSEAAKKKANYKIPAYFLEPDGMHIGIKAGEEMQLRELMEAMLIASANDASNVIAQALGPGIPTFIERLNAYLKEIGCKNTHYCNPHGLHYPEHVTTAYDLAWMTREALKNPVFCEIIAKPRFNRPKTNKQPAATYLHTNRLIRPGKYYYSKAIGVKTGYHSKAKKTFVGAARFEDRTLIVVLLGYPDRNEMFNDSIKIFDAAFNQPKVERVYLKAGLQTFKLKLPHSDKTLKTYLPENLSWSYYPAEDPKIKCYLHWDALNLPIRKNQRVGELQLISSLDGKVVKKIDLKAVDHVKRAWPHNWMANLGVFFDDHPMLSFLYIVLFAISVVWTLWMLKNRGRRGD